MVAVVLLPILSVFVFGIFGGDTEVWQHIAENRLFEHITTTLIVLVLSGAIMCALAVPAAWFVCTYEFPGRQFFSWALITPLAMPGYVMAYSWASLADGSGPIQTSLRQITGWTVREYWFPDMFSIFGLSFVLASTLFPYVYITARSGFTAQSRAAVEAARSLGASHLTIFLKIALPAAMPAIFAGLLLALMEAAADYGAADFLGIPTLGVGIIRAWSSFGDPSSAARLAMVLIILAFSLILISKFLTHRFNTYNTGIRWQSPARRSLSRVHGFSLSVAFSLVLLITCAAPIGRLLWIFFERTPSISTWQGPLFTSIILCLIGVAFALLAAVLIILAKRVAPRLHLFSRFAASAGYGAPGAVLGLGAILLLPVFGWALSSSAALFLLVWVYAIRFTAAGTEPLQAAAERAPHSLHHAARSLSPSLLRRFVQIEWPILSPGVFAGGLILFVEMLKELPATTMLAPLGWETLAVKAHNYASDERLAEATVPALIITLAGFIPVLILSWRLSKSGRFGDT